MKRITCTFHSNIEKSKIPRCDSVERLILNFKYLQKINEGKKDDLKKPSCRMKRHNSFNDNYHQLKHKRTSSSNLLNPIDILNQAAQLENDEEDEFINTLILKIGLLAKDPMARLLEFQYKTELKNLATIEYYSKNEFSL